MSLDADFLCQTRFREWYGQELPQGLSPVELGYLYPSLPETPAYPMEWRCKLYTVDEMEALQPKFPPLGCPLAFQKEKAPSAWKLTKPLPKSLGLASLHAHAKQKISRG